MLCLDRTNWQIGRHDVNILMLAIATQRFRIPLMWTVLDKAGSSNQCERIALMRRYLGLFGSGSIAWLLADREFIGGRWIKFLLKNNILFAIRVKKNSIIRFQDGRIFQLKTLLRKPIGFKLLQGQPARLEAMDKSLGTPLNFAAKRLGDGELLIVASNGPGKKALKAYPVGAGKSNASSATAKPEASTWRTRASRSPSSSTPCWSSSPSPWPGPMPARQPSRGPSRSRPGPTAIAANRGSVSASISSESGSYTNLKGLPGSGDGFGQRAKSPSKSQESCSVQPGFVAKRRDWKPYRNPSDNEHILEGVRKAGLPE